MLPPPATVSEKPVLLVAFVIRSIPARVTVVSHDVETPFTIMDGTVDVVAPPVNVAETVAVCPTPMVHVDNPIV